MKRLTSRVSPATVIASIALFVSLGGVSYGVATGSIDSRELKNNNVRSGDLRNNDVRTKDLRNNDVRSGDIRNSTLTGSDVGDDSLTGSDVLESSLGKVPSATSADSAGSASSAGNADRLDGKDSGEFLPSSGQAPSGLLMRGNYGLAEFQAPTNDTATEISFPLALSSAPTPHYIDAGAAPPAECPGTVTDPQADAGHLCIYEGQGSAGAPTVVDPTDNVVSEANPFGTTLLFIGSVQDTFARGTWAVRAP